MGQISSRLAARFGKGGRHRSAMRGAVRRIQESIGTAEGVKGIEQLVAEGLDPLHAAYASAQNLVSTFAEGVSALEEMEPYTRIVAAAEDEYLPGYPPLSPLTHSYFTAWAFFDARFGPDAETIGTCLSDLGNALGMDEGMLRIILLFQNTRMGVYEHAGLDGPRVRLRELLTGRVYPCYPTSGYSGGAGELWYVRLCPPLADSADYHVAFTTPYVLIDATTADWTAYLRKQLLGAADEREALHGLLKYGPSLHHWNEFILQGYHHHQADAIFLAGLPDVKGSLPHPSEPRPS